MTSYRPDIDGLRAIAVLVVVAFHLGLPGFSGGYVGVDVFFVISGYLITGLIHQDLAAGRFSLARFYERRLRRLAPALVIMLLGTSIAAALLLMPDGFRDFCGTLIASVFQATNFIFLKSRGYFDPGLETAPLLHLWSLAVEEQYYLLFPLLMVAAARYFPGKTSGMVAGLAGMSLAASVTAALAGYTGGYFLLPLRFWEIAAGSLASLYSAERIPASLRGPAPVIGLAGIAIAVVNFNGNLVFPGYAALLPVLSAVLILIGSGPASRVLGTGGLAAIGRISYPLYLWHWPVIVFWTMITGQPLSLFEAVLAGTLSLALATGTYFAIETPIRQRRWLGDASSLTQFAASIAVIFLALGITGLVTRGLPARLPAAARVFIEQAAVKPRVQDFCPHGRREMASEMPPCVLGRLDASTFSFAVIGDSHAEAMAGAIGDLANKLGEKGLYLGRIACLPFEGVDRKPVAEYRCAEHLDYALSRIAELDIPAVFVIARWDVLGSDPLVAADLQYQFQLFDDKGPIDDGDRLGQALGRTLDRLGNRDVSIMFSVPDAGFDVPSGFARAATFGRPPPAGPLTSVYRVQQEATKKLFERAIGPRTTIRQLDPGRILCPADRCRVADDGLLLYVDFNHPSRAGAERLAPLFEPALRRHPSR